MTGTFLDVDAPDTAWRASSEDPIPVIFGRYSITAAAYRYVTCRPLDGHARTNATFWHAGTVDFTPSHKAMPYQFWPGWKRGVLLTRLPQLLFLYTLACWMWPGWALNLAWPLLLWWAYMTFWGYRVVDYFRNRKIERDFLRPVRNTFIAYLKTRDGISVKIPRALIKGDKSAKGIISLPPAHPMAEGDRENLLEIVRKRLSSSEIDARFNLQGASPHMELFIPPQPPKLVGWEEMLLHASSSDPFLGMSAHGPVLWSRGEDSPHLMVIGGSMSGKSELAAWIVAQFMRGGSGLVVLDPKYSSHKWVDGAPGVLYCVEAAMVHDTVLWLDEELRRRGRLSRISDEQFPPITVLLEERNSLQSLLQEYWPTIRPTGFPQMSPAKQALDRLASMGRSLGMTVILCGQYAAERFVGKRSNYGSAAMAGKLPVNEWKNYTGAGTTKPGMSARPGSFGYVSGGQITVFQAAFPDIGSKADSIEMRARLLEFAYGGDHSPLNMQVMMQQPDVHTFPRSGTESSDDRTDPGVPEIVTLRSFAKDIGRDITYLQNARTRRDSTGFPDPIDGQRAAGNARLYNREALNEWYDARHDQGDDDES